MDEVFKALADPTRRSLLDELFREDGQTLSALEERFAMTRFGVMKHLKQLEEAGLVVTTAARPREAPLPEPGPDPARPRPVGEQVRRALGRRRSATSRQRLETTDGEGVRDLHQDHARAALGGDHRPRASASKYNFGVAVSSDWTPGSRFEMDAPGRAARSAKARTSRSTRRAGSCRRMIALWSDDVKTEGTSRVTWEIEPVGDSCRLIVTHDQLREGANDELYGGWPMILSGLKTLARDRRAAHHPRLAAVRRRGRRARIGIGAAGSSTSEESAALELRDG